MSVATDNFAAALATLTAAVNADVAATAAAIVALDDLAAKLAASSDPAFQAAADSINAISANLGTSSGNLSAAVAKDDPAETPAP